MNANLYEVSFDAFPVGIAQLEIVSDEIGRRRDIRLIGINHYFERCTGLDGSTIVGKVLNQAFPATNNNFADWGNLFKRIVSENQNSEFEHYLTSSGKRFLIYTRYTDETHLTVLFNDITIIRQSQRIDVTGDSHNQQSVDTTTFEPLPEQSGILQQLHTFSLQLAYQPSEEVFPFIVSAIKAMFGVKAALINTYDEATSELVVQYSSLSDEESARILKLIGGKLLKRRTFVSESDYKRMTEEGYAKIASLHELTFGAVPDLIGKAVEKMLGIDWFAALVLMHNKRLVGTMILIGDKKHPYPEKDVISAFAGVAANAICRKEAEDALKSNEEKFRYLLELAPDAFLRGDSAGNFIGVNSKAIEMFGYSKEELLSMNMKDLFVAEVLKSKPLRYDLLQAGEVIKIDREIKRKDGKIIHVEMNSRAMPDGTYQSFIRDITERKHAEEYLQQTNTQLEKQYEEYMQLNEILRQTNIDLETAKEDLERTKIQLIETIMQSPQPMVLASAEDFKLKVINKATEDFLQINARDYVEKSLLAIDVVWQEYTPEGQKVEPFELPLPRALQGKFTHNKEMRLERRDGSSVWQLASGAPIFDAQGKLIAALLVMQDITERVNAERERAHFNDLMRFIIENTKSAISVFDTRMNYIYVSKRYYEDMHLSDNNIIGRNHYDIFPDLPQQLRDVHQRALHGEVLSSDGDILLHPDGTKDFANWTCMPWYKADRTIGGIIIFIEVITERKRAEEELALSEARLRANLENTPNVAVQWYDNKGRILYWNSASEKLYGWTSEEALGKTLDQLIYSPAVAEEFLRILQYIDATGKSFGPYESPIRRRDGSSGWIMATTFSFPLEAGRTGYVCMDVDITERKLAEEELIKAKEKAEESDRLKSAFLANMSHEIRTPMNGILGFLELLLNPDLSNESREEYIAVVNKSGKRLLDTINDIIEVSKIEAGQIPVNLSEVSIHEVLLDHQKFFQKEAEEKGLTFSVKDSVSSILPSVITDRHKLDGILTNLIKNAIKFTAKGGVDVTASIEEESLVFTVKDTGIGIPPDKVQAIFERFVQADLVAYNRPFEGSGLGLSIVRAYLDLLQGKIHVASVPGKGSSFSFSIPIEKSGAVGSPVSNPVPAQTKTMSDLSILVAEDDDISYSLIEIFFERMGVSHIRATNGAEAISILERQPIDIVFMDVKMPVLNGLEATRKIRMDGKDVYIVALTAFALVGDRERTLEAGCDDYLAKPVSFNTLAQALDRYLLSKQ